MMAELTPAQRTMVVGALQQPMLGQPRPDKLDRVGGTANSLPTLRERDR